MGDNLTEPIEEAPTISEHAVEHVVDLAHEQRLTRIEEQAAAQVTEFSRAMDALRSDIFQRIDEGESSRSEGIQRLYERLDALESQLAQATARAEEVERKAEEEAVHDVEPEPDEGQPEVEVPPAPERKVRRFGRKVKR